MKVIISGSYDIKALAEKLVEVADNTALKVQKDNPGVEINGYTVADAEVTFKFDIEGYEEDQILTVTHDEALGSEVLTWIINEEGESNNEEQSLYDEYSRSLAKGKELEFKEVGSEYADMELTALEVQELGSMCKIRSVLPSGDQVVQVYQHDKLIQEYLLKEDKDTAK